MSDQNLEILKGSVERITFQSEDTGFTVAKLKVPKKKDHVTIVGAMPSVQAGEQITCQGFWKNNINFGLQFEVVRYQVEQPTDVDGIQKYLSSGLVKGIGDVFAERIVRYYGLKTLEIIENDPDRLSEVDGIGPVRLERIKKSWEEHKAVREVMLFLQQYQISPAFAQKIYKTYKQASIERILRNPYDLAADIFGIGFKTADKIARQLGTPLDAEIRTDAGIEYTLSELSNEGHTCYPVEQFIEVAAKLLECEAPQVNARLEQRNMEGRIVLENKANPNDPSAAPTLFIWLKSLYMAEFGIAKQIQRLRSLPSNIAIEQEDQQCLDAEEKLGIQLEQTQRSAVVKSLTEKIHIITGGPGTGKSTITKVILEIFKAYTQNIRLAAPTGRAAKRLASITGLEALTVHALLEFDFMSGGFKRGSDNPLDADLLVVDEASMLDTVMANNLLKAIPDHCCVLFVGDVDQLPSVGAGNVLDDLIESQRIPVTRLTEIFRQAAGSAIITNAHKVNQGIMPNLKHDHDSDFFFIEREIPDDITTLICDLVAKRLPEKYGFHPLTDIQVLSPMKIGLVGTHNLNEKLQQRINPSSTPFTRAGRDFHLRDKVMQTRNNYDKEVFNGDIGYIQSIDKDEQEMVVIFDGRAISYDFSETDELIHAYASSVHKYQGSECPCIVMPIHTQHYRLLNRNLLYTGITRGKKLVVLVGTKKALYLAVNNKRDSLRHTGLKEALQKLPPSKSMNKVVVIKEL